MTVAPPPVAGGTPANILCGVPEGKLASVLNRQGPDPGQARLSVYAEGYLVRFRDALEEVYEAIHHILGDRSFAELSNAYATRTPSHDYNLSLAGRHLPEFLKRYPLTQELPFLHR